MELKSLKLYLQQYHYEGHGQVPHSRKGHDPQVASAGLDHSASASWRLPYAKVRTETDGMVFPEVSPSNRRCGPPDETRRSRNLGRIAHPVSFNNKEL